MLQLHTTNYTYGSGVVAFRYIFVSVNITHILQGCFTVTGAIVRSPQYDEVTVKYKGKDMT